MIAIRQADKNDAVAISDLIIPVAQSQIAMEFPPEGESALLGGMTPQAIERNILQGYRYHLAFDGVRLCGVIGMRGYSHVYHLFVSSDSQGLGIGRLLWDRASQDSLAEVRLSEFTVYSSCHAEAFYHRLGFRRTGDEQSRRGVTAIPMRYLVNNRESK